jgi:hypothetical protein
VGVEGIKAPLRIPSNRWETAPRSISLRQNRKVSVMNHPTHGVGSAVESQGVYPGLFIKREQSGISY